MPTVLSRHLLPDHSPYFAHALNFFTIPAATQQPRQGQEWVRAPVYKKNWAPPNKTNRQGEKYWNKAESVVHKMAAGCKWRPRDNLLLSHIWYYRERQKHLLQCNTIGQPRQLPDRWVPVIRTGSPRMRMRTRTHTHTHTLLSSLSRGKFVFRFWFTGDK